jgi:hypothetical protein
MAVIALDDVEDVGAVAPNTNGGGSWGSLVTTGGGSDEFRPKVRLSPAPNSGLGASKLTVGV